MLRNLAWHAADQLTRAQLAVFHTSCDQIGLRDDDRRLALGLDGRTWTAWRDFLDDGPLPAEPPLPEMLRRLGATTFTVSVAAEQRANPG
jgi:hypothetical protein